MSSPEGERLYSINQSTLVQPLRRLAGDGGVDPADDVAAVADGGRHHRVRLRLLQDPLRHRREAAAVRGATHHRAAGE